MTNRDFPVPVYLKFMIIKNYPREVKTLEELEELIRSLQIIPDFKSFENLSNPQRSSLERILYHPRKIGPTMLRNLIRSLKIYVYSSLFSKEYWIIRGYSLEESIEIVRRFQIENSQKKIKKYTKEELRKYSPRCIEYWESKGFFGENALEKIKEVQSTNSLSSIERRKGIEKAKEIRDSITRKWQSTLQSKGEEEIARINKEKGKCRYKLKGRKLSDIHKKRLSESRKGVSPWNKGKKWKDIFDEDTINRLTSLNKSPEKRRKLRIAKLEYIKGCKGQISPTYNKKAIRLIEQYGEANGYNFQHAENGGEFYIPELGYWLDAYDLKNNVILEVDEKHHFDSQGNLREKDVRRQKEIVDFLNCKFIRIKYEEHKNRDREII